MGVISARTPPDTTGSRTSRREQVAMAAGVVAALRTRVPAALMVRGALDRAHPAEPHWYLNKLGTAPAARGQGLTSPCSVPSCGTVTKPGHRLTWKPPSHTLIGFYETFGFTCTNSIDVPHGGPGVWGMWRAPR